MLHTMAVARFAGLITGAIIGRHYGALLVEKWLGRKAVAAAEAITVDAFWFPEE